MTLEEEKTPDETVERDIDWKEGQQILKERMQEEVRRDFWMTKNKEKLRMSFYVRALSPDERDAVDSLAAKEYKDVAKDEVRQIARGGNRQARGHRVDLREVPTTKEHERRLSAVKEELIFYGLLRGPKDFVKSRQTIRELPAVIKTDLADTIDQLSSLGVDDEADFRPVW